MNNQYGKGFFNPVMEYIQKLDYSNISADRTILLNSLSSYILSKEADIPKLHFICTHNSRRSQIAQIWAQIAAEYFGIPILAFSGGTEVTACNHRVIDAFRRVGVEYVKQGTENPIYFLSFKNSTYPQYVFSKLYFDDINPKKDFGAIMTCDSADKSCPYIPGAEFRLPLNYVDPKYSDDTIQEIEVYDQCVSLIATEIFFVFKSIING